MAFGSQALGVGGETPAGLVRAMTESHLGQSGPLAVPEVGSCASSGRAWWLWASQRSCATSSARASRLQSRRFHCLLIIQESYRCAETKQLLHRPRELRASADVSAEAASGDANSGEAPSGEADSGEEEVTFTGSQALWSAVVRAAELTSERAEAVGGADVPALRAWDAEHRKPQPSGLLPVANVYRDARLWANTEWAAWLLLDKGDFAV